MFVFGKEGLYTQGSMARPWLWLSNGDLTSKAVSLTLSQGNIDVPEHVTMDVQCGVDFNPRIVAIPQSMLKRLVSDSPFVSLNNFESN